MDFTEQSNRYKLVMDAVRRYLLDREGNAEVRLPSEIQLANRLGISRAHVREVYRALCVFRVCESRQGEGTFFQKGSGRQFDDILPIIMSGIEFNAEEVMEVRRILEAGIAEKAAINRSPADVRALKQCLKKLESSSDYRELSAADHELHLIISRCCGNEILVQLMTLMAGVVQKTILEHWSMIASDSSRSLQEKLQEQHTELVEAIAARKPSIARAIAQEHVELVIRSLNQYKHIGSRSG